MFTCIDFYLLFQEIIYIKLFKRSKYIEKRILYIHNILDKFLFALSIKNLIFIYWSYIHNTTHERFVYIGDKAAPSKTDKAK